MRALDPRKYRRRRATRTHFHACAGVPEGTPGLTTECHDGMGNEGRSGGPQGSKSTRSSEEPTISRMSAIMFIGISSPLLPVIRVGPVLRTEMTLGFLACPAGGRASCVGS